MAAPLSNIPGSASPTSSVGAPIERRVSFSEEFIRLFKDNVEKKFVPSDQLEKDINTVVEWAKSGKPQSYISTLELNIEEVRQVAEIASAAARSKIMPAGRAQKGQLPGLGLKQSKPTDINRNLAHYRSVEIIVSRLRPGGNTEALALSGQGGASVRIADRKEKTSAPFQFVFKDPEYAKDLGASLNAIGIKCQVQTIKKNPGFKSMLSKQKKTAALSFNDPKEFALFLRVVCKLTPFKVEEYINQYAKDLDKEFLQKVIEESKDPALLQGRTLKITSLGKDQILDTRAIIDKSSTDAPGISQIIGASTVNLVSGLFMAEDLINLTNICGVELKPEGLVLKFPSGPQAQSVQEILHQKFGNTFKDFELRTLQQPEKTPYGKYTHTLVCNNPEAVALYLLEICKLQPVEVEQFIGRSKAFNFGTLVNDYAKNGVADPNRPLAQDPRISGLQEATKKTGSATEKEVNDFLNSLDKLPKPIHYDNISTEKKQKAREDVINLLDSTFLRINSNQLINLGDRKISAWTLGNSIESLDDKAIVQVGEYFTVTGKEMKDLLSTAVVYFREGKLDRERLKNILTQGSQNKEDNAAVRDRSVASDCVMLFDSLCNPLKRKPGEPLNTFRLFNQSAPNLKSSELDMKEFYNFQFKSLAQFKSEVKGPLRIAWKESKVYDKTALNILGEPNFPDEATRAQAKQIIEEAVSEIREEPSGDYKDLNIKWGNTQDGYDFRLESKVNTEIAESLKKEKYKAEIKNVLSLYLNNCKNEGIEIPILTGIGQAAFAGQFSKQVNDVFTEVVAELVADPQYKDFKQIIFAGVSDKFAAQLKEVANKHSNFKYVEKSCFDIANEGARRGIKMAVLNAGDPSGIIGQYWEEGHIALDELAFLIGMAMTQHPGVNPRIADVNNYVSV